jgi:tRNA A37 threonylcarbamoyladenosine dehydratase
MADQFQRTRLLLGRENIEKLKNSRVAIFGVGGVGGYVCEALARAGVGNLTLVDDDKVNITNINRQIIALHSTVGRYKVDVAKERIADINPEAIVHTHKTFYMPETRNEFDFGDYDYVVDAIDTVTGKIELVLQAQEAGVPIISSMGAGNKVNPAELEVADIYKTTVCPLAKVMRRELKKRGVKHLKVVYSKEKPLKPMMEVTAGCDGECICPPEVITECEGRRAIPGSTSFVPSVAGLIIAGEVVKDLLGFYNKG